MDVAKVVKLTYSNPMDVLELARAGLPKSFKPSILQSLKSIALRKWACVQGAINVPTPNETLVACVTAIERYASM